MKVYVLTAGAYSDYHICGVTLNNKTAEHMVNVGFCENVEEYETDNFVVFNEPDEELLEWCCIVMTNRSGRYITNIKTYLMDSIHRADDKVQTYDCMDDNVRMMTYCWAKDERDAIRIASDRFAKAVAERHGL